MKQVKTRQEIAQEFGISRRTFQRWLKKHNIVLPSGLVTPKVQAQIYEKFGFPIPEVRQNFLYGKLR